MFGIRKVKEEENKKTNTPQVETKPKVEFQAGIYSIVGLDYSSSRTFLLINYKGKVERIKLHMGTPIDENIISLVGARVDLKEVTEDTDYYVNSINRILL